MEIQNKNEIFKNISNNVIKQFEDVKDELSIFIHDYDFNKISLAFENTKSNYFAYAEYQTDSITFMLDTLITKSVAMTIIHEYTHHVMNEYLYIKTHTLEFAITNYCLQNAYDPTSKCFLRSYDINEDKAYRFISINSDEFDSLIKNIHFSDMKDLSMKASRLANELRKNFVPFSLGEV
jgi:hypothetical protein